ncbi:MAG: sulfotransferase [candidate division KSB1 bacterium]|nr:sulfotransferase [candidate division KSB1 bacterium]MDZ7275624.1 sulfotransferase [candidate division KSB1 bacterium]MDZ7284685.1 sulfotransferase [candidate division KSB1 bacterium]MDZ7297896.1 sulfotransferase [candidate division KSB1 bacterium]MDZ7305976.1 sulfotransferase [candidate division KSB1 bacterium]
MKPTAAGNGAVPRASRQLSLVARLRRRLRRARPPVLLAPAAVTPLAAPPIFVIGVHRSGTTLLRLILDSHSRLACPTESIFLLPLSTLWRDDKAMAGLRAMGFAEEHVLARLREFSNYFFSAYAGACGKPRWADKSPHYIDCLDFIERLYGPHCQYVFIYRHGLDVACSVGEKVIRPAEALKQACGDPYAGGARYWAEQCRKMLAFQAKHAARVFPLRYEALVAEPEKQCRALFAFLGEPWEEQVLQFYKQQHTSAPGLEDPIAATSRGFTPSVGNYHKLPETTVARMRAEAGDVLRALGYET